MATLYFQRKFIFSAIVFFYGFSTFDSAVFAQGTCIWVVVPESTASYALVGIYGITTASACQAYCITSTFACSSVTYDTFTNWCSANSSMINFNSSTTETYYGLIKGSGVTSCNSATICTWTGQKDMHSFGATRISTVNNVNDCVDYCNSTSGCVAAEWNYLLSTCWVYNSPLQYPVQPQGGIYFFTNPTCLPFAGEITTPASSMQQGTCIWVLVPGSTTNYTMAALTGVTTAIACQAYCISSTSTCYGVSFDLSTNECFVNQLNSSMVNFNSSTTETYYGLIKGSGVKSCSANTCTWTGQKDFQLLGSIQISTVTNVNDCVSYCNITSECLAVEWNYVTSQCLVYNPTNLIGLPYQSQSQDGIYFFANPNCPPYIDIDFRPLPQPGVYTVNETPDASLPTGFPISATSLQDCLIACSTKYGCSSIDWSINSTIGQQCFLHAFIQSGNVQPTNGINHYDLAFDTAAYAWSPPHSNTTILGGKQTNAASLSLCETTCQTTTGCQSINWASNYKCSLLYTQSNQIFAADVTHYDLFYSGFCIWTQNSASGIQPSSSLLQLSQHNCYTTAGCQGLQCTYNWCSTFSYNEPLISGYIYYSFQCIGPSGSTNNNSNNNNNNTSNNAYLVATIVLAIVFLSDHSVYS